MSKYYELGSRELTDKIHSDKEFLKEMESCDTVKELYDLYIKHDYTDKSYEDFEKYFAFMKAALDSYDKNQELAEKIRNDKEFLAEVRTCKNEKELYDTYVKYGYADIPFDDFKKTFEARVQNLAKSGVTELTEDELDAVVGGSFWGVFSSVINVVPFVGGFASAITDLCTGNLHGAGNIAARFAGATVKCLFDTVTTIATGGIFTIAKTVASAGFSAAAGSIGISAGVMALSGGGNFFTTQATNDDGFLH